MANKPITDLEKCKIKELYEKKGLSILAIANEIGRSDGAVKKYVQEMKLVKPPRPSLAGEKFARLTVLELDYVKSRRRYWKCQCECGSIVTVSEGNLKHGITKSCGCIKKEYLQNRKKGKTKKVKPRKNKGGVYSLPFGEIELKGNYKNNTLKEYKLSAQELQKYLEELETKEVKRRGR